MNESHDLLETSRGPEARQREVTLKFIGGPMSPFSRKCVWRKKAKYRLLLFEDRRSRSDRSIESIAKRCDRRSRSNDIEDRGAIEASRRDAPGTSHMMTRRGLEGEAPPARHHQEFADAPPVFFNYPHASASTFISRSYEKSYSTIFSINTRYGIIFFLSYGKLIWKIQFII